MIDPLGAGRRASIIGSVSLVPGFILSEALRQRRWTIEDWDSASTTCFWPEPRIVFTRLPYLVIKEKAWGVIEKRSIRGFILVG